MKRKDFIKGCGMACLGGFGITTLISGCSSLVPATGEIAGDNLVVEMKDFELRQGKNVQFKRYIVVSNDLLRYPICIYRHDELNYSALWMQCTHQGTELQAFGDRLQCPAHGSEFDNKGRMTNGPAEANLRTFPITIEKTRIKISLKAV
ncbi:Rieske (2Fe-2S) protein [Pedobacter jeongneungensis]|uniref:Rieske (2Fe-2S) protein n=2 Tax=Pedobacter TaxID=84567 RepID=A0ABP8B1Z9_9SPHI